MKIEIETGDDEPRAKRSPPPDYFSRSFRIRLMTMFAMLALVLVMMKEARKPERWAWMGFENTPAATKSSESGDSLSEKKGGLLDRLADGQGEGRSSGDDDDERSPQNSPERLVWLEMDSEGGHGQLPVASQRFWRDFYSVLDVPRQRLLFSMMRAMRNGRTLDTLDPALHPPAEKLVALLERKRLNFNAQLLERISFLKRDAPQKAQLNEQLFQSKNDWDQQIGPAFSEFMANREITMGQLASIERLQLCLDSLAYDQVIDRSEMRRPAEGAAWLRTWEKIRNKRGLQEATPVQQIELVGQPTSFRGRMVKLQGWVRRAAKIEVAKNEIGLDHFFELWMRPKDTNQEPYCVYVTRLPDGFPSQGKQYSKLNERVEVEGVFFKIRSFVAADESVRECPLILGDTFQWDPEQVAEAKEVWRPPTWALIAFFIGMPLIATLFAWAVYRNTEVRKFRKSKATQALIQNKLDELTDDETIKTDLERIKELEVPEGDA